VEVLNPGVERISEADGIVPDAIYLSGKTRLMIFILIPGHERSLCGLPDSIPFSAAWLRGKPRAATQR